MSTTTLDMALEDARGIAITVVSDCGNIMAGSTYDVDLVSLILHAAQAVHELGVPTLWPDNPFDYAWSPDGDARRSVLIVLEHYRDESADFAASSADSPRSDDLAVWYQGESKRAEMALAALFGEES